jgi:hypothetical protein
LASTGLTFSRPDAEEVFLAQLGRGFLGSLPPLSADLASIRAAARTAFFGTSVRFSLSDCTSSATYSHFFVFQIEFAIAVSEIDLAAGLEPPAVLNAFALSCPIPVHVAGVLNPTKAVEVALATYRFVILVVVY